MDQQIHEWVVKNDVEKRIRNAQVKAEQLAKKFVKHNEIDKWALQHNVEERANSIGETVEGAVHVSNSTFIPPTNNVEVTDLKLNAEVTTDELAFYGFIGVAMMAVFAAVADRFQSTKKTEIEFDIDNEAIPVPKENKKAIKQTLKNIMAKNNAKTTLIS